jgi:hypothetical protein
MNAVPDIAKRILMVRGQKVMLDADLASLYGVETRALNQAVRRNGQRFPDDFMFQLTREEKHEVITTCDHLDSLKFSSALPLVFTEDGALMLGNVLRSPRAVEVSLMVVRAFVQLREMLAGHKEILMRLEQLEKKSGNHDQAIAGLFDAIRQLMATPRPAQRGIGFTADLA